MSSKTQESRDLTATQLQNRAFLTEQQEMVRQTA